MWMVRSVLRECLALNPRMRFRAAAKLHFSANNPNIFKRILISVLKKYFSLPHAISDPHRKHLKEIACLHSLTTGTRLLTCNCPAQNTAKRSLIKIRNLLFFSYTHRLNTKHPYTHSISATAFNPKYIYIIFAYAALILYLILATQLKKKDLSE